MSTINVYKLPLDVLWNIVNNIKMNNDIFRARLRQKRKDKKLTQEELAEMLGVSRFTIINWESGKRMPDLMTAYKAATILDTSTIYLLGETDQDTNPHAGADKEDNLLIENDYIDRSLGGRVYESMRKIGKVGITDEMLADKTGCATHDIFEWRNNIKAPDEKSLQKIAQALNTSVAYLTHGTDEPSHETITQNNTSTQPGEIIEELARINKLLDQTVWRFDNEEKGIAQSILKRCIKTLERESPKDIESAKTA